MEDYPTESIVVPGNYKRVDKLLHIFDLHACDLPDFYAPRSNIPRLRERADYTPMPDIYHLIDKNRRPIVKIAGDFTAWKLIPVEDIVKVDIYSRYDRYFDTQAYLWPSHRYEVILAPGKYQYKWYVAAPGETGVWIYSRKAPLIFDNDGNLNNYIDTSRIAFSDDYIKQDIDLKEWHLLSSYSTLIR